MIQADNTTNSGLPEYQPLISGRDSDISGSEPIVYQSIPEAVSDSIKNREDDTFRAYDSSGSDEEIIRETPPGFWGVVACLLIGVIVANIDTSLVMATFGQIGSEFGRLDDANWMIVGYQLGVITTQPMYGKLSDIFGRKSLLLIAYTLFAVGCLWIGTSTEFWHVIVGRVISGIGGAGMTSVVSILLTDLVPLRDIAAWRSYVYIAATLGRSCGAPLGGFMVDTVGWRWSFLGQVPLAFLAIIMVSIRLKVPHHNRLEGQSLLQGFKRIDILGATSLAASLSLFLVFLDEAGKRMSISNKLLIGAGVGSVSLGMVFLFVEAYFAQEPILSMRVITQRDVLSIYTTLGLTTGSQIAFVATISMYFVVTLGVSNANAAARIVFGNVAHACGGLTAGILIGRTGRYKRYLVSAMSISTLALLVITIRWRGNTNIFETAYIAPAGFGIGMINTAAFVALSASVSQQDQAMATSGFYLSDGLGFTTLSSLGNAVLQMALDKRLHARLVDVPNKEEIIRDVMSSLGNIKKLPTDIREKATTAFVEALQWNHGYSTSVYAASLFIIVVFLREYSLDR